jgi:capsular polysaccharide transport system ATP-binding protein
VGGRASLVSGGVVYKPHRRGASGANGKAVDSGKECAAAGAIASPRREDDPQIRRLRRAGLGRAGPTEPRERLTAVIRFDNVTKIYRTDGHRRTILDRVSFTLKPGISYGILGINGAGKSTTMRLLGGGEMPTKGRVVRNRRVSWPLGFSGGFHPNMTGRDNIIFVARIYGEDPKRVLEFVEDFSELGSYLDVQIRTYSSGMGSRLAFGMSMAIPFDCYLIDEVTAVGDARFQKRCEEAFTARRANADVIMVSHGMDTLRTWCQQGIVLINGRAIVYENIDDAIEVYRRLNA